MKGALQCSVSLRLLNSTLFFQGAHELIDLSVISLRLLQFIAFKCFKHLFDKKKHERLVCQHNTWKYKIEYLYRHVIT